MEIGSKKWIELVQEGALQLGVTVSHDQAGQFAKHGRWLMEWNRRINLTAITEPKQVAVKHFLDAIAPIRHIPDQGQLLDIGTGGGFPGIPLKIMRPGQPMTLIDSARKKINFVKHVIRQLPLNCIQAHHTRAEALFENSGKGTYAVIICRALADPYRAVKLAAPLLNSDGKIVLYQGPNENAAATSRSPQICTIDGITYRQSIISYLLPALGDARKVTILEFEQPPLLQKSKGSKVKTTSVK
jgi:16S rRNA (guanine527-N7)-methyltransferase